MKVSVFDNDLNTSNKPNAILAEGIIIKNTLEHDPMVKWLIRLTKNKMNYKSFAIGRIISSFILPIDKVSDFTS